MSRTLILLLVIVVDLWAQERTVDPTWLHRYVPNLSEKHTDLSSASCHYKAIFGAGDENKQNLRSVARFAEVTIDAGGNCQQIQYEREEEIDFVLEGSGTLQYGDQAYPVHTNDFTYVAPGLKHGLANKSGQALRVLVMGFTIPKRVALSKPSAQTKIVNLENVKEETVQGHPTSVL
jgi:mannose-6-phosphate isomerase-like protein (cupin superfamily)